MIDLPTNVAKETGLGLQRELTHNFFSKRRRYRLHSLQRRLSQYFLLRGGGHGLERNFAVITSVVLTLRKNRMETATRDGHHIG
jgi:hypothetical protein